MAAPMSSVGIVVDSKDTSIKRWYLSRGFETITPDSNEVSAFGQAPNTPQESLKLILTFKKFLQTNQS